MSWRQSWCVGRGLPVQGPTRQDVDAVEVLLAVARGLVLVAPQAHEASAFWKSQDHRLVGASEVAFIGAGRSSVDCGLIPACFDAEAVVRIDRADDGEDRLLDDDVDGAAVRDGGDVGLAAGAGGIQGLPVQGEVHAGDLLVCLGFFLLLGCRQCRDGHGVRLRAEPVGVAGPDGVDVAGFGRYGGVGVAGALAAGIVVEHGQVGGIGAAEDLVAGDAVVSGVVPGEQHAVVGGAGEQAGGLGGQWRRCDSYLLSRCPGAALFDVAVVVAGSHPGAVAGALLEAGHRVGPLRREGVAPIGGVLILVGRPLGAGLLPGDPVVAGRVGGRVPGDDQLARIGAGEG